MADGVGTVPVGERYKFSTDDVAACIAIGVARQYANEHARTVNMNYSGRNDLDISVQGVLGEWAFCRMFAVPVQPLFDSQCRNASTDTFDATLPNGWRIDVKTAARPVDALLVGQNKKRNPADAYALYTLERGAPYGTPFRAEEAAEGAGLAAVFHGIAPSNQIFHYKSLVTRGRGQFYARAVRDLHAWPAALEHFEALW
jgi:hypothetical protein